MVKNYEKLPEKVRNLLFLISEKEYFLRENPIKTLAWAITENYDKLPKEVKELLLSLSLRDGNTARGVASAVSYFFNDLSEELRNKLLLNLSTMRYASPLIYRILTNHSNEIKEAVRNQLKQNLNEFPMEWLLDID